MDLTEFPDPKALLPNKQLPTVDFPAPIVPIRSILSFPNFDY